VEVNVAYRWFLGSRLRNKVPDASTHLKANANKDKFHLAQVQVKPQEYLAALDAAVTEDRAAHGEAPLKSKADEPAGAVERRTIKVSRTHKDSGYMVRDGKPKGFFYVDHRSVGGRHAIITDTHVTPANLQDSVPCLGPSGPAAGAVRVRHPRGAHRCRLCGRCHYAGSRRAQHLWRDRLSHPDPPRRYFCKREYRYDEKLDVYICPNGQLLPYRTTNSEGYRQYHSDPDKCAKCPVRQKCTKSASTTKVVTRHVRAPSRERTDQQPLNRVGKRIYKRRKETVERSFADAKQLQGHRYARMRGLSKLHQQWLLVATAQNIKKIALLSRMGPKIPITTLLTLFNAYTDQLQQYEALQQVRSMTG
jgi:IS5 family transposase